MKKIKFFEKCRECGGTGLFRGMGEKKEYAVVCYRCKGTGRFEYEHEYEEFTGRVEKKDVKYVLETNPGICVGGDGGIKEFGGMLHSDWLKDGTFPPKSEMRKYTCPAWWYQSTDYDKKPNWDDCRLGGMFSGCKCFGNKKACWERFDKEQEDLEWKKLGTGLEQYKKPI